MLDVLRLLIAALLVIGISSPSHSLAQSQPPSPAPGAEGQQPQDQPTSAEGQSTTDERGSAESPLVVEVLPTPQTEDEAAAEQQRADDQSAANWWPLVESALTLASGLSNVVIAFVTIALAWVAWKQSGYMQEGLKVYDPRQHDMKVHTKRHYSARLGMGTINIVRTAAGLAVRGATKDDQDKKSGPDSQSYSNKPA